MWKVVAADDEGYIREALKKLINWEKMNCDLVSVLEDGQELIQCIENESPDIVITDIQMPGVNGIEFARSIPKHTLIIFTTAYSEYALDSYEVDAVDYLVKPIDAAKFRKAVDKAITYHSLLLDEDKKSVENVEDECIFVKSDRKYFKVNLKDILFIEGLKDYVIIQLDGQRIITRMNVKTIHDLLPKSIFLRINRSYIVNRNHIESFDNNDVFIKQHEIAIGNSYRDAFFEELLNNRSI